ncbi:hypothetical protein AMATHDRAFT_66122 [Amanita thiersii Skay4041]|uniref:Uncharacterized protein n=1 Tax=Amanita thiersii Skay4041 TaxID=703135 RepID=A0A2A9NDM8_9AGAR|nr:hypothetical protein AMATHDRAFT_66122 [Amanita thiersii Skay4041]
MQKRELVLMGKGTWPQQRFLQKGVVRAEEKKLAGAFFSNPVAFEPGLTVSQVVLLLWKCKS